MRGGDNFVATKGCSLCAPTISQGLPELLISTQSSEKPSKMAASFCFARSFPRVSRFLNFPEGHLKPFVYTPIVRGLSGQADSENTLQKLTLFTHRDGIGKIVLNNPKKRNALSLQMLQSIMGDLLEGIEKKLQVIIVSASGPVFSSGHDLKELTKEKGTAYHQQVFDKCSEVMSLIQDMPLPVIAEVKGLATAAGCQLVATCDMAVAASNTKFATPGVNIGLFCSTPAVALGRAVPHKIAMEMLFTGKPISADDALHFGLVNRVVPEEKLEEETEKLAEQICATSQPVVAMGKRCFYKQITQDRDDAYRIAGSVMVENLKLEDGDEGIRAFIEKRKPEWTHS